MRKTTSQLVTLLMILSCGQDNSHNPNEGFIQQQVLFHFSHLNDAWGYQNHGWFIGKDGSAKVYYIQSPENWNLASTNGPDSGYISREALLANYSQADRQILEISDSELLEKYWLINPAAYGAYSELRSRGADIGAIQYFCYYWDYQRGKFKQVLLSLSGDFSRENLAPEAGVLDRWMKELDDIDSLTIR